jgi:DNA-binding NarL/FixJ family response regulator
VARSPTTRAAATVLLAGHAPAPAQTLVAALEAEGMTVCGKAADLAGTIAAATRERPDLCLLDAALAGRGYSSVAPILDAVRGLRVVILDGAAGDAELLDAVSVGAAGHLPRDLHAGAMTAALRDVLAGHPAFPRRVEALLAARLR